MSWLGALIVTARVRLDVYRSDLALWTDAETKAPALIRPRINLSVALSGLGRWDEALAECAIVQSLLQSSHVTARDRWFAARSCVSR